MTSVGHESTPNAIAQLFLQVDAAYEKDTENEAELKELLRAPLTAIAQSVVIDINRIANALERLARPSDVPSMPRQKPTIAELEELLKSEDGRNVNIHPDGTITAV